MRVIIQRVKEAKVEVEHNIIGEIGKGYLLLVGIGNNDDEKIVSKMADKVSGLRINEDENGKMNLNLKDAGGAILSVSQFTLYANIYKGRRPSFENSCEPIRANELYEKFNDELRKMGFEVQTGKFQAEMQVSLINDGPVTIIVDSDDF